MTEVLFVSSCHFSFCVWFIPLISWNSIKTNDNWISVKLPSFRSSFPYFLYLRWYDATPMLSEKEMVLKMTRDMQGKEGRWDRLFSWCLMVNMHLLCKFLFTHRLFLDFGCLLNSLCNVGVATCGRCKGGGRKPKETNKHVRKNRKVNRQNIRCGKIDSCDPWSHDPSKVNSPIQTD